MATVVIHPSSPDIASLTNLLSLENHRGGNFTEHTNERTGSGSHVRAP